MNGGVHNVRTTGQRLNLSRVEPSAVALCIVTGITSDDNVACRRIDAIRCMYGNVSGGDRADFDIAFAKPLSVYRPGQKSSR